jgi:hypothetical protein
LPQWRNQVTALCAAALVLLVLSGCQDRSESSFQSVNQASLDIEEVKLAAPVDISLAQVEEVFALGGRGTELQRERLTNSLIGAVVAWRLRVFEVAPHADGRFRFVSEPPGTGGGDEGIRLVHVQAVVVTGSPKEVERLAKLQVGDEIVLKGRVRAVVLRSGVIIDPAIVTAWGK